MHRYARTSLALVGLALAAPAAAPAQDAPAGYRPAAAMAAPGLDGQPMAAPAPAPPAKHAHKGRVLCARCMKAKEAQAQMVPGQIVACAHSKNGVCTTCAALLALPGTVTMGPPPMAVAAAPSGGAPGRAVVAGGPASGVSNAYDPSGMAEPAPIGVMQANYAQAAPGGMTPNGSPMMGAMPSQPGRAVASSGHDAGPGPAPMQRKSGDFPHPHIIGHLLGFTGIGSEHRQEREARKKEAHAMISYDAPGATVNELPASVVYGKR